VELFREGPLVRVERPQVIDLAIEVAVFARHDGGTARCTDGVGDEAVPEEHPLVSNTVQIRCLDQLIGVGGDGALGVVVRHNEEDVWPGPFHFCCFILGGAAGAKKS